MDFFLHISVLKKVNLFSARVTICLLGTNFPEYDYTITITIYAFSVIRQEIHNYKNQRSQSVYVFVYLKFYIFVIFILAQIFNNKSKKSMVRRPLTRKSSNRKYFKLSLNTGLN